MGRHRFITAAMIVTILTAGCGNRQEEIPVVTFPVRNQQQEAHTDVEIRYNDLIAEHESSEWTSIMIAKKS